MTNAKMRKMSERTFIGNPNFPRLNFEGSSGSLRNRLSTMQEIETMYDDSRAHNAREEMLLKATIEPMLIRANKHDTTNETKMALTGTSQPGRT